MAHFCTIKKKACEKLKRKEECVFLVQSFGEAVDQTHGRVPRGISCEQRRAPRETVLPSTIRSGELYLEDGCFLFSLISKLTAMPRFQGGKERKKSKHKLSSAVSTVVSPVSLLLLLPINRIRRLLWCVFAVFLRI